MSNNTLGRINFWLPLPLRRLLKKGLPRPRNKDLRHEFDREIRSYVDGPDFLSSLLRERVGVRGPGHEQPTCPKTGQTGATPCLPSTASGEGE